MRTHYTRITFIFSTVILLSTIFIFQRRYSFTGVIPILEDHLYPSNFSSLYKNIVLLSCSSYSYTSVYCYYLPYAALAWRRLGFEPIVFLVGSEEIFKRKPLINLLENDLKIKYHYIESDSARSISVSQLIRLFGGFISYEFETTKDLFIIMADVDLVPISRHRFEIFTNQTNYILAVNAYCCPTEKFSYENFHNIHYYPISYVGMKKDLWKKIFLPLNNCQISSDITIDMIECCLKEKINQTIPANVIKGSYQWDIDQKLLSLLIARTEQFNGTYIDKRTLGHRLDPKPNFLSDEFDSILLYDDVHLPTRNETIIFSNHTWNVLSKAFSRLFNNQTMELLSSYHYQTVAMVFRDNKSNTIS